MQTEPGGKLFDLRAMPVAPLLEFLVPSSGFRVDGIKKLKPKNCHYGSQAKYYANGR
jgi:hypothetical protein